MVDRRHSACIQWGMKGADDGRVRNSPGVSGADGGRLHGAPSAALIDVGSEGYGALATKVDIADMATKADIRELELRLRELELRMRLHVGAYVAVAAALVVAILGLLLALFTGQFA